MDHIADFLLKQTNIHVSGACSPHHTTPIECYYPQHHSYQNDSTSQAHGPNAPLLDPVLPGGGCMRRLESLRARDGHAVVYDRDMVTTWRLPSPMATYEVFF